jgi:hypothetical protein
MVKRDRGIGMITKRDVLKAMAATPMLAGASAGAAFAQNTNPPSPSPDIPSLRNIGEQGFIYGLPIVMNYAVMYEFVINKNSGQWKAPFNSIANDSRVFTYKDTAVVTPNSDTPYSMVWADLRAEPLILRVPDVEVKRYYSAMLCDGNTYNYGYIGSRATGNSAGVFLVVGPDWKGDTPVGIRQVFRSSTEFSLIIYRTQLFGPDDIENVRKIQAGYGVISLSSMPGQQPAKAAPAIEFPYIDNETMRPNFFEYLDFALQFAPPQPNEAEIRALLARIGVGPGKTIKFTDLSLADRLEIALGMRDGAQKVDEAVSNAGAGINGWRVSEVPGSAEGYAGNWLLRAAVAKAGIYANTTEEAVYPFTRSDSDGQKLDGSQHDYTLTFAKDGLPPVNAFWSVTMYDGKTQLLIENPINRYLINSPMLPSLKRNDDGSLTIYIQNKSPGEEKDANWLPAPDGPIYLVLRLYWPKTEQPSILPIGQGTWKPPSVMRVS